MPDLVVLVADLDMQNAIEGLLAKPQKLRIPSIEYTIRRHLMHDAGCFHQGQEFLQSYKDHTHALVIFDHDGCGQENRPVDELQVELENRLIADGWDDRARVVIIKPELEIWVWSESSEVDAVLGWSGKSPALRDWLRGQNLLPAKTPKPDDPKETLKKALRQVQKQPSAALFRQLAERISVNRCTDSSFTRLKETLQGWFPQV